MATITLTPASGSITALKTVVRVDVSAADSNDDSEYSTETYPTREENRYYLLFDAPAGTDDKRSYVFNVSADGDHQFNSFIFDAAGSWTVRLRNAEDDQDVATSAVTVS
jgi:hypothetical protein